MMKRLSIVVPTAIGGFLLAACGAQDAASAPPTTTTTTTVVSTVDSTPSTPSTPDTSATPTAGAGLEPVHCGEVTLDNGAVHGLIATPAANGIVGCTEAFNVLDEFLELPPEKRSEASLGNVQLASGWSCTVDDGVSANISCGKDKVGDDYGLALRTEQQAG